MTDREAMKMALEALDSCEFDYDNNERQVRTFDALLVNAAHRALHEALAQPEQYAVAWMWKDGTLTTDPDYADGTWTPLYTAPPSKQWVGLTDEDTANICMQSDLNNWRDNKNRAVCPRFRACLQTTGWKVLD